MYAWKGPILSHIVSRAHTGPVFAMFTCLEDGLIVTAGKETGGRKGGEEGGEEGEGGGGGGWGEVKLWSSDMSQSRTISLGQAGPVVVRSVCRSKVGGANGGVMAYKCTCTNVISQGFIQGGGHPGISPPKPSFPPHRISGLYYDISIDLMQVLGL